MLNKMGVEWENAREAIRLAKKDTPSHVTLVLGLYAASCKERELGKVARSSYFFMRRLDDILDGDLKIKGNPLAMALHLRAQIDMDTLANRPGLAEMAKYSIRTLEKRGRKGDNPKADFLEAVDSMIFDYGRSQERLVLTQQELADYYQHTFSPVVNILLIGLKSELRATDMPEIASTQGRLYTLRDIEKDWPRGTINIPAEVLEEAKLTGESKLADVKASAEVKNWAQAECRENLKDLDRLNAFLDENAEPAVKLVCGKMTKWMERFAWTNSALKVQAPQRI